MEPRVYSEKVYLTNILKTSRVAFCFLEYIFLMFYKSSYSSVQITDNCTKIHYLTLKLHTLGSPPTAWICAFLTSDISIEI